MLLREVEADRVSIPQVLPAVGLSAVFSFQLWRIAEYGFAFSLLLYLAAWIFLSFFLLGFSIDGARTIAWWARGTLFGLLCSIPVAVYAITLGMKPVPGSIVAIAAGIASGLIVVALAAGPVPRSQRSPGRRSARPERPASVRSGRSGESAAGVIPRRLAEENACLEHLLAERECRRDATLGTIAENRIVWRELLDLELQEIDEQVNRIAARWMPR